MISSSLKRRLLSILILLPISVGVILEGEWVFKACVALAFGVAVKEWLRMAKATNNYMRDGILGVIYLLIGFLSFTMLRSGFDQGIFFTITLMFGVWASDSAAYFSGKYFGGPKLAPRISPNKTWAGFVGGTLGSALVVLLLNSLVPYFSYRAGLEVLPIAPWRFALIIGALFTAFGQVGDLAMSAYKRKVGFKDTGTIIPGHGGLLDRIDSLLLVTPFFVIVLLVLAQ
jgi:phosphatidate cytidylyltransferase